MKLINHIRALWNDISNNIIFRTNPPIPVHFYPNHRIVLPEQIEQQQREPLRLISEREFLPEIQRFPRATSSHLNEQYYQYWCGSTINELSQMKYDPKPIKHFLCKHFSWIEDVTSVDNRNQNIDVHVTISPIHHTELMNPIIEKKIRDFIMPEITQLMTCMYNLSPKNIIQIIYHPSHSETILEHIK